MHVAPYGTRLRQARSESELSRTGLGALLSGPGALPQAFGAAARGAVWDAFFRQNLDLLPGALPQAFGAVENARARVWPCGK